MTPRTAEAALDALGADLAGTIANLRPPPGLAAAEARLAEARERRGRLWERHAAGIRANQEVRYSIGSSEAERRTEESGAAVAEADADIRKLQAEVDRLRGAWAPAFQAALMPYRDTAARLIHCAHAIVNLTHDAAAAAHQGLTPLPYIPPR